VRTFIRSINLARWFPFDNALSVKMARLCIIREDLLMEFMAIHAEDIEPLDGAGARLRRMYFLRNSIKSLQELSSAVHSLLSDAQFKALLEKQTKDMQARFERFKKLEAEVGGILKNVRNEICGHVQQDAVRDALQRISEGNRGAAGFLEANEPPNVTCYEFAHELAAEILLEGVSAEERETQTSEKYAKIREFLPTFTLIEQCVTMYLADRGFFD
jgi:hypothetical protein